MRVCIVGGGKVGYYLALSLIHILNKKSARKHKCRAKPGHPVGKTKDAALLPLRFACGHSFHVWRACGGLPRGRSVRKRTGAAAERHPWFFRQDGRALRGIRCV